MTKRYGCSSEKAKKSERHFDLGSIFICFMSLFCLALIIRNSDAASKYMGEGLSLCARIVIPSLFPFMVISDILIRSSALSPIAKFLRRPAFAAFGISGEGALAVLLGLLCGFPIGARVALSLFEAGRISRAEAERVLTFSNIPSSAFIINAVGTGLFRDRSIGRILYISVFLAALLCGFFQRIIFGKCEPLSSDLPCCPSTPSQKFRASDIPDAISSSAFAMLKVCSLVVFFTAFLGTLSSAISSPALSPILEALIFGSFELTSGIERASHLAPPLSILCAAFISGWAGLSVHFQIMSICRRSPLSFRPYFLSKLIQSIMAGGMVFLIYFVLR